jgi:septum formation topological specificity factor MinE
LEGCEIQVQFGVVEMRTIRSRKKKPTGFWGVFSNLKEELLDYVAGSNHPGIMPTQKELQKDGHSALAGAIKRHGGFRVVAERLELGLSYQKKHRGYWRDFTNVEQELLAFIRQYGMIGVMPTSEEFNNAGRSDLGRAISLHGGHQQIAERLGLTWAQRRHGYWQDFSNVRKELLAFISKHGTSSIMPTNAELKAAGRNDLANAISDHGGYLQVASRLNLKLSFIAKSPGYWDDFTNVEQELRSFINGHGTSEVMPTQKDLLKAGRSVLSYAITRHGGFHAVAERLGISPSYSGKPRGYWDNFTNLAQELQSFIQEHGRPSAMPTDNVLDRHGRSDLSNAIGKHGGFSVVARRLGLTYTGPEYVTQKSVSSVAHTARAIQPLAESNLLSGAQVMVILRRAGLLEYRNQRILRLNAGLARGKHDEIESAIANLVSGGEEIAVEPIAVAESDALTADEAEALASVGLDAREQPLKEPLTAPSAPDTQREQAVIRGLSALGELRLPLDHVLQLLTAKILWQAFYKRLYSWYGSLDAVQTVTADDVQAAILAAYPEHTANEFVAEASALFTYEVEQAVNFAASLADFEIGRASCRERVS